MLRGMTSVPAAALANTRAGRRSPATSIPRCTQAVTPNADFQFVNIARWATAQDFMTAIQSPGFRQAAADLAGYRSHPSPYKIVA